jgi:hypothetical protein
MRQCVKAKHRFDERHFTFSASSIFNLFTLHFKLKTMYRAIGYAIDRIQIASFVSVGANARLSRKCVLIKPNEAKSRVESRVEKQNEKSFGVIAKR